MCGVDGSGRITVKLTIELLEISRVTAGKLLQGLVRKEILRWLGNSKKDPMQFYTMAKPLAHIWG